MKGNIIQLFTRFIQYRVHFLPLLCLKELLSLINNHIIYLLIFYIIFVCAEKGRVLKGEAQGMCVCVCGGGGSLRDQDRGYSTLLALLR